MTDPKIIAELRELLGQYAMRIEDSDGDSCCFCGDSFSVDHGKEDCGFCHACASDHMANDVMPVLASLLADSERLRLAVEGLDAAKKLCRCKGTGRYTKPCTLCGDSTYDHYCNDEEVDCTNPNCVIARDTLAKIKDTP